MAAFIVSIMNSVYGFLGTHRREIGISMETDDVFVYLGDSVESADVLCTQSTTGCPSREEVMSVFPDWVRFAVPQKRPKTGCIAAGYEMMLRAAGVPGIDYATFQDDFDLDRDLPPGQPARNTFTTVADTVKARYPNVTFAVRAFDQGRGHEKLRFIEDQVSQRRPLLISLANAPFGGTGWHIMPVVDMDQSSLTLMTIMHPNGTKDLQKPLKSELVRIHDQFGGGNDVAYLDSW